MFDLFDLFGRKARAERDALQAQLRECHLDLASADDHIRELADIVREYDQAVYNIAQVAPDWNRVRPIINQLQIGQESRMKAESNRIGGILRRELIGVYHK